MTAEPTPPPADDDPLVQVNIRIPRSLRDGIDARRALIETPDGRQVSRDKWAARVFTHALRMPLPRPTPAPHRRPPSPTT